MSPELLAEIQLVAHANHAEWHGCVEMGDGSCANCRSEIPLLSALFDEHGWPDGGLS